MNKYKVTEEFLNELNKWNKTLKDNDLHMDEISLDYFPRLVDDWIFTKNSVLETIDRLITIKHFVNGEDVFEAGNPYYIVQRKDAVVPSGREYLYVFKDKSLGFVYSKQYATRFDDYMQASEWAGIHFEVVEVYE